MAVLKCKMCGGDLQITPGISTAECEYCGTRQTLPKANEEVIHNLFNRANALRLKCEFDKAEQIYEKILQEKSDEAEAHWGIVLCKYGIEYVEDPKTYRRIPTCHRTSYDAVTADTDYLAAISHGDAAQRSLYEAEAKAIDIIQKNILNIVKNEKPFDVFLCYKETDEQGRRTVDSAIANDIYYQLTREGLKVFYAAITLEDKLGQEYEPYIFAALNSAKVMLVIGTKPHYFTSVWVKNEWSRFLKRMKTDRSRLLIPCYRDMDAYELPEEFAHLQAQDMTKIGFIADVVRGIQKVVVKEAPKVTVVRETASAPDANVNALLKRAFLFLEDGEWSRADEFCERVLNMDPECTEAYLGKLMAQMRVHRQEELQNKPKSFETSSHYQKILRFGDPQLIETLQGYIRHIQTRNESTRLEEVYSSANQTMAEARTEGAYLEAARLFESVSQYKDSEALGRQCREKAETARKDHILAAGKAKMVGNDISAYESAIRVFQKIAGWKDADAQIQLCQKTIRQIKIQKENDRKDTVYIQGCALLGQRSVAGAGEAIALFDSIAGWKDAEAKKEQCLQVIEQIRQEEEHNRLQQEKKQKDRKRALIFGGCSVVALALILVLLFGLIIPTIRYNQADALLAEGNYEAAMEGFRDLDFKDSYDKYCLAFENLRKGYEQTAQAYYDSGDYIQSAIYYRKAGIPARARQIFDFAGILRAEKYLTAGVAADGQVYYQSNYEYDWGDGSEVQGIVRFLPDVGGITGVDAMGRVITHRLDTFDCLSGWSEAEKVVGKWTNIVDLVDDLGNIYAVISDGTVKTYLDKPEDQFVGTHQWKDIVSIQSIGDALLGIDRSGRVLLAYQAGTAADKRYSVDGPQWEHVVKVISNYNVLIGLTEQGSIAVSYRSQSGTRLSEEVLAYTDVVDLVFSGPYLAVLHADGRVSMELVGSFTSTKEYVEEQKEYYAQVVEEISQWHGIVSLQHGAGGYIGIRYDGTVKYISDDIDYSSVGDGYIYREHETLKKQIESWKDIVWIDTAEDDSFSIAWQYAVAVRTDGTVVSTGDGTYYTIEENASGNGYHGESHKGGTYHDVISWRLW